MPGGTNHLQTAFALDLTGTCIVRNVSNALVTVELPQGVSKDWWVMRHRPGKVEKIAPWKSRELGGFIRSSCPGEAGC